MYGVATGMLSIAPVWLINKLAESAALTGKPHWWPWLNQFVSGINVPWYVPVFAGITGAGVAWFFVSGEGASLVTMVENLTRIDVDGDGQIGDKNKNTRNVLIEDRITENHRRYIELPDTPEWRLYILAVLKKITTLSQDNAKSYGVGRKVLNGAMKTMLDPDNGYAEYRNGEKNQGAELTARGKRKLAQAYSPTGETLSA